jgi:hypothetical protein
VSETCRRPTVSAAAALLSFVVGPPLHAASAVGPTANSVTTRPTDETVGTAVTRTSGLSHEDSFDTRRCGRLARDVTSTTI